MTKSNDIHNMCNEATELLNKKHCPFRRNSVHISQSQCTIRSLVLGKRMPQSIDKKLNGFENLYHSERNAVKQ